MLERETTVTSPHPASRPGGSGLHHPLGALLTELLRRISAELPGALGVAISVRRHAGPLTVLATEGIADHLDPAQIQLFGGPVPEAAAREEPVITQHALADPRWPELTVSRLTEQFPAVGEQWSRVIGIAAVPGPWADTGTLVLSATLDRPAEQATLHLLRRYEKLVAMALLVAEAGTGGAIDRTVELLQSRAAIEEAKGAIIAVRRCSPDAAWRTLRTASQELNVKLRELAVALIEHLGHAAPPQPSGVPPIIPTTAARQAAATLWAALS